MSAARTWTAAAFLIACMVLGGASAAGVIGNAALQIAAIAILLVLLLRRGPPAAPEHRKPLTMLIAGIALLALIQLLPLPPALWTALPGRAAVAEAFGQLDLPLPWMPVTLAPEGTIASLLALLPPLAMLALLLRPEAAGRQLWPLLVVAIALVQLVLGIAQVAGGRNSPLYFYAYTNWGHEVGFFSNTNHHATLLLMAMPFAAALASQMLRQPGQRHDTLAKTVIAGCIFAVLAGGVIVNGSRAGLVLLPLVLILCGCMIAADLSRRAPRLWFGIAVGTIAVGIAAAGASGVMTRQQLGEGGSQTSRAAIWERSWPIAVEHQPTGSGLGSFVPLYRMAEDPGERPRSYANHAHNDYLEWFLETGMPGLILLLAFFIWYARRSWGAWSRPEASFARAGSIAVAAVAIHSLVDYPIRTAAIAALTALCCALLATGSAELRKSHPLRSR